MCEVEELRMCSIEKNALIIELLFERLTARTTAIEFKRELQ